MIIKSMKSEFGYIFALPLALYLSTQEKPKDTLIYSIAIGPR